jgi:peroxiredoxin
VIRSLLKQYWLMAFACLVCASAPSAAAMPSAGELAPDFVLKSASGKNIRLSELRGQVVMINFWATWCGPCRQELPLMYKIYQRYRDTGFVVLAVNIEEDTAHSAKVAKSMKLGFPVLFDPEKRVSRQYDPPAMPATLIVDKDGRVRYVHLGYKPGYEDAYERQVRELLRE